MPESHTHFLATVTFTESELEALDRFISEPDTRTGDIFRGDTVELSDQYHLDWIIKHDLFEGVVMQVSLMDTEAYRFLAGTSRPVTHSEDILDDVSFIWKDMPVTLRIQIGA